MSKYYQADVAYAIGKVFVDGVAKYTIAHKKKFIAEPVLSYGEAKAIVNSHRKKQ